MSREDARQCVSNSPDPEVRSWPDFRKTQLSRQREKSRIDPKEYVYDGHLSSILRGMLRDAAGGPGHAPKFLQGKLLVADDLFDLKEWLSKLLGTLARTNGDEDMYYASTPWKTNLDLFLPEGSIHSQVAVVLNQICPILTWMVRAEIR